MDCFRLRNVVVNNDAVVDTAALSEYLGCSKTYIRSLVSKGDLDGPFIDRFGHTRDTGLWSIGYINKWAAAWRSSAIARTWVRNKTFPSGMLTTHKYIYCANPPTKEHKHNSPSDGVCCRTTRVRSSVKYAAHALSHSETDAVRKNMQKHKFAVHEVFDVVTTSKELVSAMKHAYRSVSTADNKFQFVVPKRDPLPLYQAMFDVNINLASRHAGMFDSPLDACVQITLVTQLSAA